MLSWIRWSSQFDDFSHEQRGKENMAKNILIINTITNGETMAKLKELSVGTQNNID